MEQVLTENEIDLLAHYQKYFHVVIARKPEELELVYQLRHQIFHIECGFNDLGPLSTEDSEKDEFDDQSIHVLLFHKGRFTLYAIGYIRLVLAATKKPGIPIEKHYSGEYEFDKLPNYLNSGASVQNRCEISRMSILGSFRRRKFDHFKNNEFDRSFDRRQNSGNYTNKAPSILTSKRRKADIDYDEIHEYLDRRRFHVNYLPLCLIFSAIHLILDNNLEFAFAFSEKRIARFLSHFGTKVYTLGQTVDCYGKRTPYIVHAKETVAQLQGEYRSLYEIIGKQLNAK